MRVPQRCPTVGRMALTKDDPKAVGASVWALGDYHRFAGETVWELGPYAGRGGRRRGRPPRARRCGGNGQRRDPRGRGGGRRCRIGRDPRELRSRPKRGRRPGCRGRVGRGRRAGAPVRSRLVRRRHVVLRRDLRAGPSSSRGRAPSRVPAGRGDRHGQLHAGRAGGCVLRAARHVHAASTPGAPAPTLWGDEAHVRRLFGNRVISLELERRSYVERSRSPQAYRELFETAFGPIVALRQALGGDPTRLAEFDGQLAEFTVSANRATPGAGAEYPYDYLLVVARR